MQVHIKTYIQQTQYRYIFTGWYTRINVLASVFI